MSETATVAYRQIIGKRSRQEDFCLHATKRSDTTPDAEVDLMVLADGMGGHEGGDVAAPLVCDVFRTQIMDAWDGGEGGFVSGLDAATRAIGNAIRENETYAEMGSTLVGATIRDGRLRWISVGDSLLYLFDGRTLKRLNADHSMASVLDAACRRGEITPEEAASSSQRNVLLSAVTSSPASRVDLNTDGVALAVGNMVIIASDGLGVLTGEQIATIVSRCQTAEAACQALLDHVEAANHPRQDNTTVIVAQVLKVNGFGTGVDKASEANSDSVSTRPVRARAR